MEREDRYVFENWNKLLKDKIDDLEAKGFLNGSPIDEYLHENFIKARRDRDKCMIIIEMIEFINLVLTAQKSVIYDERPVCFKKK